MPQCCGQNIRPFFIMKGLYNHLNILRRMFQFRFAEGTSIKVHFDEFNKFMMELKDSMRP